MSTEATDETQAVIPWWVSWYGTGGFEYHGPWWLTGWASDEYGEYTIGVYCAAVMAESEHDAQQVIWDAHDDPADGMDGWRFTESCPADWKVFGGRFKRYEWMRWPWPEQGAQQDA